MIHATMTIERDVEISGTVVRSSPSVGEGHGHHVEDLAAHLTIKGKRILIPLTEREVGEACEILLDDYEADDGKMYQARARLEAMIDRADYDRKVAKGE